MLSEPPATTLADDLVTMLDATGVAERALFASLDDARMAARMPNDAWSALDLLGHLGAWRAIEARRLNATAGLAPSTADDPSADEPVDDANARLVAERRGRSRADIEAEAEASLNALGAAIRASSVDALCECDQLAAGIGANGINHAIGHLGDVARLVEDEATYAAFADAVEHVLARSHLPPRDSGVMLYNLACHRALSGDLHDARRLLRRAFTARRADLVDFAQTDPDLAALRDELADLATP